MGAKPGPPGCGEVSVLFEDIVCYREGGGGDVVVETTGLFSLLQLFSELGLGRTPRSVNGGREIFQFLFSAAIQVKCLILLDISCYIN